MKKTCWILLIIFSIPCMLVSQSFFQDSESKGSLVLVRGGIAQVNLKDSSIKISSYIWNTKSDFRFAFELSGKAANGVASIFEKKEAAPEAKVKLALSYHELFKKKSKIIADDWLVFQIGYGRGQYKLFDETKDIENQIKKEKFDGFSFMVFYNTLFSLEKGNLIAGISMGYDRQNNFGGLEKVEIKDVAGIYEGNGIVRSAASTQTLRKAEKYEESDHFLVNADILWMPGFLRNRIGVDLFGRYDSTKGKKLFKPGLAVLVMEKNQPTKVVGGITFELVDKQFRIGLFAGLSF